MPSKNSVSLVFPCAAVDTNWVHPDMRRQVRDMTQTDVGNSISLIHEEAQRAALAAATIQAEIDSKNKELTQLLRQVEALKQSCKDLTVNSERAQELSTFLQEQAVQQGTLLDSTARHLHVSAQRITPGQTRRTAQHSKLFPLKMVLQSLPFSYHARPPPSSDVAEVKTFFETFLPLFYWNSEGQCAAMRPVSAQPCLLAQARGGVCPLAGCQYSHVGQADWVKRTVLDQVDQLISFTCEAPHLCVVSETVRAFASAVEQCGEVGAVEQATLYFAELIVRAGWHRVFLSSGQSRWMVHALCDVPADVPPTEENLRHSLERQAWASIAAYTTRQSLYATRLFQDHPDAVSWRCLLRACATSPAERLWLAKKGTAIFPSSPHLHVHYIVALAQSGATPQECCDACLESAQVLANQVAASNYVLEDAHYSATASRYIAFLFAYVAAFLDEKLTGRAAAMQLLECATNMNGGSFCLLPAAVYNLRVLLIAMNYGERIGHVPLAALSDAPLVLPTFSRDTSLQCAKSILCEQTEFCKACRQDDLLDDVLEDVDTACSLSSVRMTAQEGAHLTADKIDPLVTADTPLSQGAVWLHYTECVFLHNGRSSYAHLRDAIVSTLHNGGSGLCPALLLTDYFSFFGHYEKSAIQKCCDHFAESHDVGGADLASLADRARALPAVRPLEWVSYFILLSRLEEDPARVPAYLDSVPLDVLVRDANAATLWAFAYLKHAAEAENVQLFGAVVERYLYVLRESHLTWWSPLDTWYHKAVGLPHEAALHVYRCVPLLLGVASEHTPLWRGTVLEVASALGVLHPLFSLDNS